MSARQLIPQWDLTLIAASIGISLLGAFTSTQLMCQAKTSRHFVGSLVWIALGSLTFGFCSIWSLHEVAMLAYGLDLRIGINVFLTILSAILAVAFTFIALASDLLYDRYSTGKRKTRTKSHGRTDSARPQRSGSSRPPTVTRASAEPLLHPFRDVEDSNQQSERSRIQLALPSPTEAQQRPQLAIFQDASPPQLPAIDPPQPSQQTERNKHARTPSNPTSPRVDSQMSLSSRFGSEVGGDTESFQDSASYATPSHRSSSFGNSSLGLGGIMGIKRFKGSPAVPKNPFIAMYETLWAGLGVRSISKGFFWAIAITSMHYVGIRGLEVPRGYVTLNPYLVALSGLICWIVCVVGCVLILEIEIHLGQQLLFSVVATSGVAAMHFTGMRAATFYSYAQPTPDRGYPPALATAIAAVAISTCLAANLLLAHSATVSRNKLAEVVWTRRKLWMAIAQKESAETAAAARSEFIASASHEIRTPLHHLQGYSDLLSRTELTEEGQLLLYAIQRATKSLSLITNNVLDWSRLEKGGEATCRPVSLDLRTICESLITLLPNQDEDVEVEILVVVADDVPHSLFMDETYIHRILMNLLSNAVKFTYSGCVLLTIEMKDGNLVASVTDTGCGVPPNFVPQLFEPFKQAQVRGRARGTGLGLSIIRQLLDKMHGTIEVQSFYQDDVGVGPENSGSTFTITIPVSSQQSNDPRSNGYARPKIALFQDGGSRALVGMRKAWETFGYEVAVVHDFVDLSGSEYYILVGLNMLKQHPMLLHQLINQTNSRVLIPYDTQASLHQVPGLSQAPSHVFPIQKPLLLHSIKKRTDLADLQPSRSNLPRAVRFDPVVTNLEESGPDLDKPADGLNRQQSFAEVDALVETVVREENPKKARVVLLVEDNPINCKLGKKMLQSLGYEVIIAEDGVFAIEQIMKHDADIDAILMDQSMPRKDGVTATREIRAMESEGILTRTRPIVAVSAVVSVEAQTLFKLAGANDFLAKPLSLGRLELALATHLHVEPDL